MYLFMRERERASMHTRVGGGAEGDTLQAESALRAWQGRLDPKTSEIITQGTFLYPEGIQN